MLEGNKPFDTGGFLNIAIEYFRVLAPRGTIHTLEYKNHAESRTLVCPCIVPAKGV